ncbi:Regulator_of chromosome condensation 1/beta-lactamase-inhibitor protein II [Hexamita inflata]|uniref:Regulator of chromosome condensation 1/beta-lactamase-inhibitor protein II n=1 Tax=Hexamita inflata TaxID=28002 RepID=A0AA86N896_9EUKA|nr:Regulator of chromosome condensation 1/beta-lactamase-inhibitor protein II [Hexamita inflata]
MIFAFVLAKVKTIVWNTDQLVTYEYSKDYASDFVQCFSNQYQVMPDGSLKVKGIKYGLQNQASLNFEKTDIQSVSRVYCIDDEFYYLTKSGQLMVENGVQSGKLQFKQVLTQHVLDINSTTNIVVVLTTEGLFIKGECQARCGIPNSDYSIFTKVTFSEFTQKIVAFHIGKSGDNIFLYLENGDVYLTGESNIYPIPQDTARIRKIGNGIKSVELDWNATIVQNVLYYLRGTNLVMYSDKLSPKEQIIYSGVIDFRAYLQQIIMIKEDKVELNFVNSTLSNFEPLYCAREPTDPLCIKINSDTYDNSVDCIQSQEKICLLYTCAHTPLDPVCQFATPCGDEDYVCWAIWCAQSDSITRNEPKCYINPVNTSIQILQQKPQQIFFIGEVYLSYFDQDPNTSKNKVSPGGAAGIAIAVSVVVFTLILIVIIILLKRKTINSTESVNSVVIVAQPVEAL